MRLNITTLSYIIHNFQDKNIPLILNTIKGYLQNRYKKEIRKYISYKYYQVNYIYVIVFLVFNKKVNNLLPTK